MCNVSNLIRGGKHLDGCAKAQRDPKEVIARLHRVGHLRLLGINVESSEKDEYRCNREYEPLPVQQTHSSIPYTVLWMAIKISYLHYSSFEAASTTKFGDM